MELIRVKGKMLEMNGNGFLANVEDWDRDVATYLAEVEGILMTPQHWEVVHFLRDYYGQYKTAPKINLLVKELGSKPGLANIKAKDLYQLYPCGLAVQACKIAGLPGSTGCV